MMYPLVLDLAADNIPVAVTCRVLGLSTQAFYKWRAKPICDRDYDDAYLINAVVEVHHDDPEFGYRFITDELTAQGWTTSRNRVNRSARSSSCGRSTLADGAATAGRARPCMTTSSAAS